MSQSDQCLKCKHRFAPNVCDAYPDGIPEPIMLGEHDHRLPYEGDGGIRFELSETFQDDPPEDLEE